MDAAEIVALINACNPWNMGADTTFIGNPAKLIDARIINKSSNQNRPGTIIEILDENEKLIGLGIAKYGSDKAKERIGQKNQKPLVHYDYFYAI